MYFSNHYATDDTSSMVQNFIKAYNEKYGATPNALAALGYDAAIILFDAIKKVDASGVKLGATDESYQAIIDAMFATDMDCVTGHITFDADNNPIKDARSSRSLTANTPSRQNTNRYADVGGRFPSPKNRLSSKKD
jgi:branched-chain amino acid transport system substrate-binding protein